MKHIVKHVHCVGRGGATIRDWRRPPIPLC
jgi:hypothetical protein